MDFVDIAEQRQSCRSFDPKRIPTRAILQQVVETALLSPSAVNGQPYRLTIAMGTAATELTQARLFGQNAFLEDCPAYIVIQEDAYSFLAKIGSQLTDINYKLIDIGILVAFITARATELGLETCIIGSFNQKQVQAILQTKQKVPIMIAIGYGSEKNTHRTKKRKPFQSCARFIP